MSVTVLLRNSIVGDQSGIQLLPGVGVNSLESPVISRSLLGCYSIVLYRRGCANSTFRKNRQLAARKLQFRFCFGVAKNHGFRFLFKNCNKHGQLSVGGEDVRGYVRRLKLDLEVWWRHRTRVTRPTSSSRMRVIYHNWSATKQRPHPQSVAEISHQSVLSGDRFRQCETSSGSRHKDTDQCL